MTAFIVLAVVVLAISAIVTAASFIEPHMHPVWSFLGIGDDAT